MRLGHNTTDRVFRETKFSPDPPINLRLSEHNRCFGGNIQEDTMIRKIAAAAAIATALIGTGAGIAQAETPRPNPSPSNR